MAGGTGRNLGIRDTFRIDLLTFGREILGPAIERFWVWALEVLGERGEHRWVEHVRDGNMNRFSRRFSIKARN
jgi:hypothetical protein